MDERRIDQQAKARQFADLHIPGEPLVLYNIWDAGGTRTIAKAGAKAIATGSASLASAQGYPDGEQIPLDFLLQIVSRIVHVTDLPVSVDFEGAYASAPDDVASNVRRIVQAGAVGINFEDQIIGSDTLYTMYEQSRRIRAAHAASEQEGVNLFINARTDLFLKERDSQKHVNLVENAVDRASAYREAGAKGFFVPGLTNPELIARICEQVVLPVNVMMKGRLLPEIRTASRGSLKSCLIGYILQSWSGFVPDACRGGQPVLRRHRPPVVKPERAGGRGRIQFRRGAKAEN